MLTTLISLIISLAVIDIINAQGGICDYFQDVQVGKLYHIFSPNYPTANYPANTACRWTAKSDRPIRMTCNYFHLPNSPQCSTDVVIIRTSSAPGQRYCGTASFSVVSEGNQITTELYSSPISQGGQFVCTIEAINITNNQQCRCGWKNPSRIVGGKNTGINEFPMMAGLVDFILKIVYCGATIVNNQQVITAAHCVQRKIIEEIGVLVGDHDLNTGADTNARILFKITRILMHPQYASDNQDYDIALVTIQGSIRFNLQVGPACLPIQHSLYSFTGDLVDILGWGTIGAGERMSNVLQKAQVSVINNADCWRTYKDITARQLCTLGKDTDSCQHDSGGPVLWRNPTTGRIILTSIITGGGICADGNPSINTRVSAFIDWILSEAPSGFVYCAHE
ncbi:hypothetical protein PV325_005633 [Microctonus aethiopoides]|uniref:Venom serine protease 34 n=1 Tax=Microctonus aethiopoides TaxID=144406 RepID=A0AA39FJY4_9HYME|nr:hypothetical protein PV325_005633 [Microctonus aethiopoides]KAK0170863.1 hypothetical protein PV328_008658 [Microctonus aethiopoides]